MAGRPEPLSNRKTSRESPSPLSLFSRRRCKGQRMGVSAKRPIISVAVLNIDVTGFVEPIECPGMIQLLRELLMWRRACLAGATSMSRRGEHRGPNLVLDPPEGHALTVGI